MSEKGFSEFLKTAPMWFYSKPKDNPSLVFIPRTKLFWARYTLVGVRGSRGPFFLGGAFFWGGGPATPFPISPHTTYNARLFAVVKIPPKVPAVADAHEIAEKPEFVENKREKHGVIMIIINNNNNFVLLGMPFSRVASFPAAMKALLK